VVSAFKIFFCKLELAITQAG